MGAHPIDVLLFRVSMIGSVVVGGLLVAAMMLDPKHQDHPSLTERIDALGK